MSQLIILEPKDPDDTLDYGIDWEKWLTQVNDTIADSEWTVPDTITEEVPPVGQAPFTNTRTTIWLSGGEPGLHSLTNTITTVGERVRSKTIIIRVKEL